MSSMERQAEVTWEGNLLKGQGRVRARSGTFGSYPLTWASRTDEHAENKTSPEELIAAAHAGCYSMALSHTLTEEGKTPENLTVNAVCTFDRVEENLRITTMTLNVQGKVPGMDASSFTQAALKAEQRCTISNALRNNVVIRVNANLEEQ